MRTRTKLIAAGLIVAGAGIAGATVAVASGDAEAPITGPALDAASKAALAHTGGGRVTDTEVGDEESFYEIEVTMPGGRSVDVQLDRSFTVVGSEADEAGSDAN